MFYIVACLRKPPVPKINVCNFHVVVVVAADVVVVVVVVVVVLVVVIVVVVAVLFACFTDAHPGRAF